MNQLDVHTHTIAGGHGTRCTVTDLARAAERKGLSLLGISDHGPALKGSARPSYFRNLALAPKKRFGVELFYGVELNILDYEGKVDLDPSTLKALDYAIASIHPANLKPGSYAENTEAYIGAMKNPHVKIIGHCDDGRYPVDYRGIVQAAREYGAVFEINNSSLAPGGYRGNARERDLELLEICLEYQMPLLLSSDSHGEGQVGEISHAEKLTMDFGYPTDLIFNYNYHKFKEFVRK